MGRSGPEKPEAEAKAEAASDAADYHAHRLSRVGSAAVRGQAFWESAKGRF